MVLWDCSLTVDAGKNRGIQKLSECLKFGGGIGRENTATGVEELAE